MAEIDAGVLNSLAEKLDALDLSDAEQAVLDQLIARAEAYEPEVEGFGFSAASYTSFKSGADLSKTAFQLGSALKLVGGPAGVFDPGDFRPPPP